MRDQVVVVGASGFGRETLDTLDAMITAGSSLAVLGVVDDSPSEVNLGCLKDRGGQYLGSIDVWLSTGREARFVLAIGSPTIRQKLVKKLESVGLRGFTAVHPTAVIRAGSQFAEGVVVSAGAVISTNVRLGKHSHINPGVIIGHDSVAEEYVSVNPGAVISGEVRLSSGVLVGAAATVLQQLTVGHSTTVGAAALVTKNVPSQVVVKGVPGAWE